jgi:hypothetical protein
MSCYLGLSISAAVVNYSPLLVPNPARSEAKAALEVMRQQLICTARHRVRRNRFWFRAGIKDGTSTHMEINYKTEL